MKKKNYVRAYLRPALMDLSGRRKLGASCKVVQHLPSETGFQGYLAERK